MKPLFTGWLSQAKLRSTSLPLALSAAVFGVAFRKKKG